MTAIRNSLAAAVGAALLAQAGAASAQAYIGNVVGTMVANGERDIQARCEAGIPADAANAGFVERAITERMTNYFASARTGDARGVAKQFLRTKTTRWRGPDGALGDWKAVSDPFVKGLPAEAVQVERTHFVVANNARGARAIYVVSLADPAAPEGVRKVEYAVDFVWDLWWGRTYIQHMALSPTPGSAAPPQPYCELAEADSY
jgi:hypothetical protein